MAFDGSGTYVRSYNWVSDRIQNIKIQAARHDTEDDGFATGLTLAICKDGQSTTSARIPFAAGIKNSDGTVSAPAYNFTDDTDCGLYRVGTNNIAIAAGGVKVFDIDGATASAATGLKVTSNAAASGVALAVNSSGTNEGLFVDAKGSGTIRLGATSTGAVEFSRNAVPTSSDGAALGTTSLMWSDAFFASGAVLNFNNGDVTITHSANALAFAGASSGYTFDAAVSLGTSAAFTAGTIELGHASDTTLARVSAGLISVEGDTVALLTATQTMSNKTLTAPTHTGTTTTANITASSNSANALAVGPNGTTNPVLQIDGSTASAATGLKVTGAAAASGLAIAVISSGTNENLTVDAKGSGTITVGGTSTGAITLTRATTMSAALTYGGTTLTNAVTGTGSMVLSTSPSLTTPTLGVATATSVNGLTITTTTGTLTITNGKTASVSNTLTFAGTDGTTMTFPGTTGTVLTADSTATLTNKTLTAPIIATISNTGTLTLPTSTDTLVGRATTDTLTNKTLTSPSISGATLSGTTGTANITATSASANALAVGPNGTTNPAFNINAATASAATGIQITAAAAAGGVALAAISSGTDENLTVDAKGAGTITLGGTSTGAITLTRATTLSAALTYGGTTLTNAVTGTGSMVLSASPTFTGTVGAAAITATGNVTGPAFRSTAQNIADDAIATLTPPTTAGILMIAIRGATPSSVKPMGLIAFRVSGASVAPVAIAWNDATNVEYGTGVPTGTTGTNGKIGFYCNDDGNVYVENRLGSVISPTFTFFQ